MLGNRTTFLRSTRWQNSNRDPHSRHVAVGQQFFVAVPEFDMTLDVETIDDHMINPANDAVTTSGRRRFCGGHNKWIRSESIQHQWPAGRVRTNATALLSAQPLENLISDDGRNIFDSNSNHQQLANQIQQRCQQKDYTIYSPSLQISAK